jgi:diguanylate cyclase (GGDEF)-like protein
MKDLHRSPLEKKPECAKCSLEERLAALEAERLALRHDKAVLLWEKRRLRRELEMDELTGLRNARSFEKKCLETMARVEKKREASFSSKDDHISRRQKNPHAVAFVDLDGLQWTNNHPEFGYIIGDRILIALANILNRWRRQDDLVVRRSGDEFLLLFPGSSKKEAERLLLENRRRFERVIEKRFPGLIGKVSFSFGAHEVNLKNSEKEITLALESAGKDMHYWKERRKMDRSVSSLSGDAA